MISRHWKGIARSEAAEAYIQHLQTDTFPHIAHIDGFVSASILNRSMANGIEFLIITIWDSMAAIQQFAGSDPEVAVVPQNVQAMMIEYDRHVIHYDIEPSQYPRP